MLSGAVVGGFPVTAGQYRRNGWAASPESLVRFVGIGGQLAPESLVSLARIRWSESAGIRRQDELFVCGRAVNGYEPVWTRADVATSAGRIRILDAIRTQYEATGCQMRWITDWWNARTGYNTARSAFWRVIREATYGLGIVAPQSLEWSASLAWGNLYRVAPGVTGNPSAQLQRIQLDLCGERLARDLAILRPRRMLFLAGMEWVEPFLHRYESDLVRRSGLVQGYGTLHLADGWRIATVIAKHPQGKPEGPLTAEVLDCFSKLPNDR